MMGLRGLLSPLLDPPPIADSRWPALVAWLRAANLTVIDIGARGGPSGEVKRLAKLARYVACEPESTEAARLREGLLREGWRDAVLLPEAVGTKAGPATLHVTRQPGLTSLLRPDAGVVGRFVRSDGFEIERTAQVTVAPLDDLAQRYGFRDASFLKVDTQGTELDILRSGDKLLRGPIVGVAVEAEFLPIYEGQPLFADLDMHLRGAGFALFDLHRARFRRARPPTRSYSRGQVLWCHALYLRDPTMPGARPLDMMAVARLVALAIAFDHLDLARDVLATTGTADPAVARDLDAYAAARSRQQTRRRMLGRTAPDDGEPVRKDGP